MRAGADSSHRALIYDRDALLQLRECKNRLSVQPPSGFLMTIISNARGGSDVTYSLLPASKRIRRPMCGIRLVGATARSRAARLPRAHLSGLKLEPSAWLLPRSSPEHALTDLRSQRV